MLAEIDREANVAGMTTAGGFSVFVSNDGSNGTIGGSIGAADTTALALTGLDVSSDTNAAAALTTITSAITTVGPQTVSVGTLENHGSARSASRPRRSSRQGPESRIRDANIAEESANFTRYSILTQSGIAALAQANSSSGAVLALLR